MIGRLNDASRGFRGSGLTLGAAQAKWSRSVSRFHGRPTVSGGNGIAPC
jgi:hypothetical protein